MTAKYGIYFYFLFQQGGDIPPCGAEWGVRTPPPPVGNPDAQLNTEICLKSFFAGDNITLDNIQGSIVQ